VTGTMKVMSPKDGDFKITWDAENDDEVANAKQAFDDLIDKRFKAYKITRAGRRTGVPIKEFDPSAQELLIVPAMAGG
jgi:hypothetical protein